MWIITFDSLSIIYHFFVAKFEFSWSKLFNEFITFCVSIIYIIVAEFCEKLKVVSSDFSIIKNIFAPNIFESLPIELIYCGSYNLVCLLKSIAINL